MGNQDPEKKKYNNIVLIPTDFSETCNNAIHHGVELARSLNYAVCILHVINKQTKSLLKKEKLTVDYVDLQLKKYKDTYEDGHSLAIQTLSREGSIFTIINEVAAEIKANMMVLGTHGKLGMQHLFGSYALRVVLDSPCPVVVVQKRSFGDGYSKLVIPISNDLETRQKVQWVLLMAKLFGSEVHLFQAHENDPDLDGRIHVITSQITKILDENNVRFEIIKAEKTGDFANQVISYSVKIRADLIMIMTVPHIDVPGFSVSAWDETMMFNEAEIPVMCINPTELGNYYYEWLTLTIS
jgi:nucleotide-binding universal stress UspA family protein